MDHVFKIVMSTAIQIHKIIHFVLNGNRMSVKLVPIDLTSTKTGFVLK